MARQNLAWYLFVLLISATAISISKVVRSNSPEEQLLCKVAGYHKNLQQLANFEKLLERQADLNKITCKAGLTLFTMAYKTPPLKYVTDVRPERYDSLELLLKHGFNVNTANAGGNTPLHVAATRGDINIIYLLIERGADINARNDDGATPLHLAVYYAYNHQAINLLLHLGADPNIEDKQSDTPLKYALENYSLELAELLLQHGVQPSIDETEFIRSRSPQSAEEFAALFEKYRKLRTKAISSGITSERFSFNPPSPPSRQFLPALEDSLLIKAIDRNEIDKVRTLIARGVDLNTLDRHGYAALHSAIRADRTEIAKLLIEAGADLTLQDYSGEHPLFIAAGNSELTQLLLERDVLVDRETAKSQLTALMNANNVEVSKILLEHGADINHKSKNKQTALLLAIEFQNLPLVKFLLEHGANTSLLDDRNRTPLFFAIESDLLEVVKLLLDYVTEEQKKRAYDWAMLNGNSELENILSDVITK